MFPVVWHIHGSTASSCRRAVGVRHSRPILSFVKSWILNDLPRRKQLQASGMELAALVLPDGASPCAVTYRASYVPFTVRMR